MGGNSNIAHNVMLMDEEIIIRAVTETMKLYNVSHPVVIEIREMLLDKVMKEKGWKYLQGLENKKLCYRTLKKVLKIECRYPGILNLIASTKVKKGRGNSERNLTKIAKQFGLTKQRISQIRKLVFDAALLLNISPFELIDNINWQLIENKDALDMQSIIAHCLESIKDKNNTTKLMMKY